MIHWLQRLRRSFFPGRSIPPERLEDAVKALHQSAYDGRPADLAHLAGVLELPLAEAMRVAEALVSRGLAERDGAILRLSPSGQSRALALVRAHRLIETRLARETSLPAPRWHAAAHAAEHRLSPEEADALANRLGNPRFDPHGDPIPTREGSLPPERSAPLSTWDLGRDAEIAHIEDEPPRAFARLHALGLAPGLGLRPLERTPTNLSVLCQGRVIHLSGAEAAQIRVTAPHPDYSSGPARPTLATVAPGHAATLFGLSPACLGAERNRLLDLGFVSGTTVEVVRRAFLGSPVVYRIRGTQIALRREQAERIFIQTPPAL